MFSCPLSSFNTITITVRHHQLTRLHQMDFKTPIRQVSRLDSLPFDQSTPRSPPSPSTTLKRPHLNESRKRQYPASPPESHSSRRVRIKTMPATPAKRARRTSTMTKLHAPAQILSSILPVYLQTVNRALLPRAMHPCHAVVSARNALRRRPSYFRCLGQKGTGW